jgi:hypothetical protein
MPMHDMNIPQPMPDDPFKDDVRPLDPNAPPTTRQETFKPYWKKGTSTVATPAPTPARPEPAKLDPYAVAPPVHIKARPIQAAPRIAAVEAQEVAPVSLTISDDAPPSPPMLLPVNAPLRRLDASIPANPLRR